MNKFRVVKKEDLGPILFEENSIGRLLGTSFALAGGQTPDLAASC